MALLFRKGGSTIYLITIVHDMRKWATILLTIASFSSSAQKKNTADFPVPCLLSNGKYIYTDRNLKPINTTQYDSAFRFREGFALVHLNGKWEVIDEKGKIAFASPYDYPGRFWEGMAAAIINGKWGFIDKKGKIVIPAVYDEAMRFSEGIARVRLNNKWGFINKSGKLIIPAIYESALGFSEGMASVKVNTKWGFIDSLGRLVIPNTYEDARYFSEGFANVKLNDKWGFINKQNNWTITPAFGFAEKFSEGLAAAGINNKWGFIDKTGQWMIKNIYEDAFSPIEGLARVKLNGKWGFINKDGLIVIPPQYNDVNDFDGGIAGANYKENGKLIEFFIDKTGKEFRLKTDLVSKLPCPDFSITTTKDTVAQGSIIVFKIKSQGKLLKPNYGWTISAGTIISGQGTTMIKVDSREIMAGNYLTVTVEATGLKTDSFECRGISSISLYVIGNPGQNIDRTNNDNSPVPYLKKNGKFIYVDRSLKPVITREFDNANLFEDGIAKVRINKKVGFINFKGEYLIPVKYDYTGSFFNGHVLAQLGNTSELLNKQGNIIMTTAYNVYFDYNTDISEGMIRVRKAAGSIYKFGYIDLQGSEIIPIKFDIGNDFSEGLAAVEKEGNWGYIDKTGKTIIPFQYQSANNFKNGVAKVMLNGKYGLINKTGKFLIAPNYFSVGYFSDGLAPVSIITETGIKTGYHNISGKQVIPYDFEAGEEFSEGMALVKKYGMWGYIDKTGKTIIPFYYKIASSFSEGLAAVKKLDGKQGYIDKNNKWVITLNFEDAGKIILRDSFHNGFALITFQDNNSLRGFYIDKMGREFREK